MGMKKLITKDEVSWTFLMLNSPKWGKKKYVKAIAKNVHDENGA